MQHIRVGLQPDLSPELVWPEATYLSSRRIRFVLGSGMGPPMLLRVQKPCACVVCWAGESGEGLVFERSDFFCNDQFLPHVDGLFAPHWPFSSFSAQDKPLNAMTSKGKRRHSSLVLCSLLYEGSYVRQ